MKKIDMVYWSLKLIIEVFLRRAAYLEGIIRENMNKTELVYRIAKTHNGNGYLKKAIELIFKEACDI